VLVAPVQRLSAEYEVARLRQSTHPAIQQRFIFLSLAHKSPISKLPQRRLLARAKVETKPRRVRAAEEGSGTA